MDILRSLFMFLFFIAINNGSLLKNLNSLRREYAKKYNVPNMHELIWSDALVDIAKNWNVSLAKARMTWRYDESVMYIFVMNVTREAAEKYFSKRYNNAYTMEASSHSSIQVGIQKKVPGSECYKRYKNDNGLCVPNNKEEESYYGNARHIFDDVNRLRKKYSKIYNVSDMHQLIWSEDLLKNLQNMPWDNVFQGARVTWRYVKLDNYIRPSIESELSTFFKKTSLEKRLFVRSNSDKTLSSLEFLNPLQKFMACSQNPKAPNFVCLLGTEGKFTMFDSSDSSKEVPGSNCQKRYTNNSGICVAIKPEDESYFGRQLDFMSDINQIRRRYAKEYRVPDMHELTWSNELAEVLDPLNMNDVRAQTEKTWRYGALNTYDNTIYHIEAEVTSFFEMNRTAKKDHIKFLLARKTAYRLEFLNPFQKTIACGQKEDGGRTYVVCLLGPEGNFTMFDTTFQSHLTAGSKCDEGYHNEDGLCSLPIPTQVPIIDYRKMAEEEKNKASTEEPGPDPLFENHGNTLSLGFLFIFLFAKWFHSILN